jgi:hypothetical protein
MPDCSLAHALDGGKAKFDAIVLPGMQANRFTDVQICLANMSKYSNHLVFEWSICVRLSNGPVLECRSKTGRIHPVLECKMAAKAFNNWTQKES